MAPYPSGKGEVCKTFMRRFESARRLLSRMHGKERNRMVPLSRPRHMSPRLHIPAAVVRLLLAAVLVLSSSVTSHRCLLPGTVSAGSPSESALLPPDAHFEGVYLNTEAAPREGASVQVLADAVSRDETVVPAFLRLPVPPPRGISHVSFLIITQNSSSEL